MIEGSLEVKLPTIWTDEKQTCEESEKRRKKIREEKEDQRRERVKSEDRRCRCAKRRQSREPQGFSNDLWLRRVEK
jgi:hypothetical protein